uniref:IS1 family transposase n=1 Tax=Escherichia coli TaxID=562 RepID=A0A6M5ZY21_ECOLX|nr:IS1 family transposase [Escherichia coli]
MPGNCPHYGRWPQHGFTSLKKLRPQSVTSRIQPGSDVIVCAEMDEQWGYVGAKSRQRWLFYAYDRIRRTVVAHVFGERTLATLERLLSLLSSAISALTAVKHGNCSSLTPLLNPVRTRKSLIWP